MIRNRDFNPDHAAPIYSNSALNISNETLILFFRRLIEHQIKFLVSGGIATAFHGYIRPIAEVEIWIASQEDNLDRFSRLFKIEKYQSPLSRTYLEATTGESFKLLISSDLCCFKAHDFDWCYGKREQALLEGMFIPIINLSHLLAEKIASGGPEEKEAILALEKIKNRAISSMTSKDDV